jgi:hypothetical protein
VDWNDRQNDCEAWDQITNYANPLNYDMDDLEAMEKAWKEMGEPLEVGQLDAAIRYMEKCQREGT